MIVRRLPSGVWQPCQMRQIKAGEVFYTCDGAGRGPLPQAAGDAQLIDRPRDPRRQVWHVAPGAASCATPRRAGGRVH